MSVKTALATRLTLDAGVSALVGFRVYPVALPQNAPRPAITYQRMPSGHDQTLTKASGTSLGVFRIRSFGDKYSEADQVAEAVRQALQAFSGTVDGTTINAVVLTNDFDEFFQPQDASDQGVFCVTFDFHVRYAESIPV